MSVLLIKCEKNYNWLGLKYLLKSLFRLQSGKILGLGPSRAHLWFFFLLQLNNASGTSACTKFDVDMYYPQRFSATLAVVCFFFLSLMLWLVARTCYKLGENSRMRRRQQLRQQKLINKEMSSVSMFGRWLQHNDASARLPAKPSKSGAAANSPLRRFRPNLPTTFPTNVNAKRKTAQHHFSCSPLGFPAGNLLHVSS